MHIYSIQLHRRKGTIAAQFEELCSVVAPCHDNPYWLSFIKQKTIPIAPFSLLVFQISSCTESGLHPKVNFLLVDDSFVTFMTSMI